MNKFLPFNRWNRTIMSMKAVLKAWPTYRLPVTFSRVITPENDSARFAGSERKVSASSHALPAGFP